MPARRRPLASLLLALLAALIAAPPAYATDDRVESAVAGMPIERLALAVIVNGRPAPDDIVVERQGPVVWMAASDLRALGVAVAGDRQRVALQSIKGLSFAIDDGAQTLTIGFGPGARQSLRVSEPPPDDAVPVTPSGWGAVVSYDVSATWADARATAGGLVEGTVYSPHGYAYAGALVGGEVAGGRSVRRLDTNLTFADPNRTQRITVGDFIAGTGGAARSVRMAGVRIATDFALRPDLVTFPLPSIGADAAVPSAVDLIVNGSRQRAGDVAPGSFAVTDVPVQTGLNTVSVAVRDALGREQLRTVTTYASTALLTPGLSAWSASGGWVRTGYASRDDRYRGFAAAADWRRGLSSGVTAAAHGEAARGLVGGGIGATVTLNRFGLINAGAAASAGGGTSGVQLIAGWERIAHPVALSARLTVNSNGWRDIAARYGAITRRHSFIANISFNLGRFGSLSGTLLDVGRGWRRGSTAGGDQPVERDTFTAATYSVRLDDRVGLTASAGGNPRRARSVYASLGLLVTFGPRTSGYGGVVASNRGMDARADIARPALLPGEFGYRGSVSAGVADRVAGGVEYLGPHGYYGLDGERTNGRVALRASARGSLVVAGGGLFATDRLDGSFAIVDASGQAGIPIYRDHRRVGRTDRHGRLIVANLVPYEPTRIAFDPDDLPVEAAVADSEAMVRPAERAGARLRFRIYRDGALTLRIVGEGGTPLPAGTRATINGTDDVPIGFDGVLYLLAGQPRNTLVARLPDGHACEARFARPQGYRAGDEPITVTCREVAIATAAAPP